LSWRYEAFEVILRWEEMEYTVGGERVIVKIDEDVHEILLDLIIEAEEIKVESVAIEEVWGEEQRKMWEECGDALVETIKAGELNWSEEEVGNIYPKNLWGNMEIVGKESSVGCIEHKELGPEIKVENPCGEVELDKSKYTLILHKLPEFWWSTHNSDHDNKESKHWEAAGIISKLMGYDINEFMRDYNVGVPMEILSDNKIWVEHNYKKLEELGCEVEIEKDRVSVSKSCKKPEASGSKYKIILDYLPYATDERRAKAEDKLKGQIGIITWNKLDIPGNDPPIGVILAGNMDRETANKYRNKWEKLGCITRILKDSYDVVNDDKYTLLLYSLPTPTDLSNFPKDFRAMAVKKILEIMCTDNELLFWDRYNRRSGGHTGIIVTSGLSFPAADFYRKELVKLECHVAIVNKDWNFV